TVVYVTPVTSFIERWQHDEPGVNRARAKATVYRALGIPSWADEFDLEATDRWFDGDTFFERENLARSIPRLLGKIRRAASMHFRAASSSAAGSADEVETDATVAADGKPGDGGGEKWWENKDLREFVKSGFQELGLSLLQSGAEAGGKFLLGNLLDLWGLK